MNQMLAMVEEERKLRARKRQHWQTELEAREKAIDGLRTEATTIDLKIRRLHREKEQFRKLVEEEDGSRWADDFSAW